MENFQPDPLSKERPTEKKLNERLEKSRRESVEQTQQQPQEVQKVKRTNQGTVEEGVEEAAP